MQLKDFLFSPDVELESIAINSAGASLGSSTNIIKRIGDKENRISIGTAGAYMAKMAFREHAPYYREYTEGVLSILPAYHFLKEVRRQLSGTVTDSTFSDIEEAFYKEYQEYVAGTVKTGEILLAVETFDKWLMDELQGNEHPTLNRDYTPTHKWMKLEERI